MLLHAHLAQHFYSKDAWTLNMLGTKEKWKTVFPPTPPPALFSQNLKERKGRQLECTFGPSIGCMKFSIFKKICQHLQLEWDEVKKRSGKCENGDRGRGPTVIWKDKRFKKNQKYESNIVEMTHLCIMHRVYTSKKWKVSKNVFHYSQITSNLVLMSLVKKLYI